MIEMTDTFANIMLVFAIAGFVFGSYGFLSIWIEFFSYDEEQS